MLAYAVECKYYFTYSIIKKRNLIKHFLFYFFQLWFIYQMCKEHMVGFNANSASNDKSMALSAYEFQ